MTLEFFGQILVKYSNTKFYENPLSGGPTCSMRTEGRTDGHNEANSRFSQFCERAKNK